MRRVERNASAAELHKVHIRACGKPFLVRRSRSEGLRDGEEKQKRTGEEGSAAGHENERGADGAHHLAR